MILYNKDSKSTEDLLGFLDDLKKRELETIVNEQLLIQKKKNIELSIFNDKLTLILYKLLKIHTYVSISPYSDQRMKFNEEIDSLIGMWIQMNIEWEKLFNIQKNELQQCFDSQIDKSELQSVWNTHFKEICKLSDEMKFKWENFLGYLNGLRC